MPCDSHQDSAVEIQWFETPIISWIIYSELLTWGTRLPCCSPTRLPHLFCLMFCCFLQSVRQYCNCTWINQWALPSKSLVHHCCYQWHSAVKLLTVDAILQATDSARTANLEMNSVIYLEREQNGETIINIHLYQSIIIYLSPLSFCRNISIYEDLRRRMLTSTVSTEILENGRGVPNYTILCVLMCNSLDFVRFKVYRQGDKLSLWLKLIIISFGECTNYTLT
jgi:hypothetical protein